MKKSVAVIFGAAFLRFGTVSAADATNVVAAADSGGGVRIVVEASRLDSSAMEMPQFVEVVSFDGIAKSGARDVMDAVERTTGVFVRHIGGGNPAMTQVSMRGYGENSAGRVLVVADGEVLNNMDMSAPDFSRLPLASVDRIEVLHGPQTVLHGANASAGMINFVMAEPEYSQKSVFEIHGGNWNTIGGSAATRGGDEEARVSYRAGASWEHSDGYRDNSGFDLWRANGGVRKDFENGSRLKISSFYSDSQYELPGALTYEEWKHDARMSDPDYSYYDCRQTAYGMNLSGNTASDGENVFKFATSLSHRRDRYASCNKTAEYVQDSPFDLYSLVFTPQYVNMSGIGDFENEFTLGGSVRWDVRKGFNQYDYPAYQWKQKEDQSRWMCGGFARDEFFIGEDVSVFAGARLERMMTRSESLGHPSRNDNLSAHEAGVNWRMAEDAKLFAKWARFYRAPFVDEVAFASGRIVSPERGWSFDVGGDWEMIENFTAGGSLYLSETENEIYYDPFLFDNCNLPGSVRRTGGDLRLKWEMEKKAAVTFRYGFVNPEIVDGSYRHEQMPAVPRHRAAVDGRIFLIGGFSVRGGCRYVGEQYSIGDFRNEYGKMKGYVLFSLGFRYEAESDRLKGLAVDIDVDNLFDRDYCDYATYGANFYPGVGRSFMVKVTYEF